MKIEFRKNDDADKMQINHSAVYTLTTKEYLKRDTSARFSLIVLISLCVVYNLVYLFFKYNSFAISSLPFIVFAIILIILFLYFFYRYGMLLQKDNIAWQLKEYMIVDDIGINGITKSGELGMSWDSFIQAVISPNAVLLQSKEATYLCLPKSRFTNEQFDEFRNFIRKGIDDVIEV